jgi:hypothetical protein
MTVRVADHDGLASGIAARGERLLRDARRCALAISGTRALVCSCTMVTLSAWRYWGVRLGTLSFLLLAGVLAVSGQAFAAKPSKQCVADLVGAPRVAAAVAGITPASVLASYAILRRPQIPSDVPPPEAHLGVWVANVLATYDPSETRLVSTTSFDSLYLVVGTIASHRLSAKCQHELPGLGKKMLQPERELLGTGPGYCLIEFPPQPANGPIGGMPLFCGASFALNAQGFEQVTGYSSPDAKELFGLVPDGVGAVTDDFTTPLGPLTYTVTDNVAAGLAPDVATPSAFTFTKPSVAKGAARMELPTKVTWLTAPGGSTVATFNRSAAIVNNAASALTNFPYYLVAALALAQSKLAGLA